MSIVLYDNNKNSDWPFVPWDIAEEKRKDIERHMNDKEKKEFHDYLEQNQIENLRCNSETEDFLSKFGIRGLGPKSIELVLKEKAVMGFYIVIDNEKGFLQYENGKLQWLYEGMFFDVDLRTMKYTTDATKADIETFIRLTFNYWDSEESESYNLDQFIIIIERNIPVIVRIWLESIRNFSKKLDKTVKINREKNYLHLLGFLTLLDKLLDS